MAENTAIEWAHHTFNPWIGCTKVSPACDHCYAESWSKRYGRAEWGNHPRQRTSAANWRQPLKWNREAAERGERYRVFCASLSDVFDNHGSITSGWHGDLWHLIAATPHLDWLLLTKRPQNIPKMLPESYGAPAWGEGWANVWLGTTAENQTEAERRIPHLLAVPARIRFLSCEPLLGSIDLEYPKSLWPNGPPMCCSGHECGCRGQPTEPPLLWGIDWIIAGGESGPGARPAHPGWVRSLRDQCKASGVAFHFKQWGEWAPWHSVEMPEGIERSADGSGKRLHVGVDGKTGGNPSMPGDFTMYRLGKARAGRTLDGVIHHEFPASLSVPPTGDDR